MPAAGGTARIVTTPLRFRNDALNRVCTYANDGPQESVPVYRDLPAPEAATSALKGGMFEPATAGSAHGRALEFEGVGPNYHRGMVCPCFFNL